MLRQCPKVVATVLLLVFTQKGGLRLWMHDWFHENRGAQVKSAAATAHVQLQCDCFDDAMMPLLGSPVFTVPPPACVYASLTVPHQSPIISAEQIYYSLKGPPITAFHTCRLS